LAQSLAGCAAQQPGRLGGIIAAQCSPDVQGALMRYCQGAGVSIN
jgi:hypothetical protein